MTSINELLQEIVNGDMDAFEEKIKEAFKIRSKNKGSLKLADLKAGTRVRLVNCQKSLEGATGTVIATVKNQVMVSLDKPGASQKKTISCPPGLLRIVK